MKATELRINNLVYNDFTRKQMEVYPMMIVQLSKMDNLDNSNIKPIPLTEEWLLKFGFKGGFSDCEFRKIVTKNCSMSIWIDRFDGNCLIGDEIELTLQYVHQLQNLYFALTNEELTFKSE